MKLTPKQELDFRVAAAKAEMHYDIYQALSSFVDSVEDIEEADKVYKQISYQRKTAMAQIKKAMDIMGVK